MSELSRIQSALAHVSAADRDTWVTNGIAIKSELGDEGFDIWDAWSKQAHSYDAKDARNVWKSINPNGKVGIGTLFHAAKKHGWHSDESPQKLTPGEIEAKSRDAASKTVRFEAEERENQEAAKQEAAIILNAAVADPNTHPYTLRKKSLYIGQRVKRGAWPQRDWDDALLVQIYQADGQIWSIEAINVDGKKDSLKNGKKSGGFHPFGKVTGAKHVLIGEGFSTMAACYSATEIPAVAALSAGNLKAVAEAVLKLSPNAEIIFIADNDIKLDDTNPGLKAATDAAVTFHARLAIPELGGRSCDFWDVWSERGPEYVEQAIAAADVPTLPLLFSSFKHRDYPGHDIPDQQHCDRIDTPESWPEPQPLVVKVEPEPYPIDALPDTIRAAVEEVAGFVKAPIPLVACSALGATSLAIQGHVDIKRAEKLTGPVGLFLLTIADSGERKSTCDGFFMKAIRDYEEAQAEAAKPILKDQRAEMEAWEAKYNGIKEMIKRRAKNSESTTDEESALRDLEHGKPEPQRVPRLLYSDATPEALADALAKQWPSGGIVSAEAGIVFGSHGMGKDSVMRNLAMMNQLWDGNSLTIDRKTTDSFTVRGARLTVALQVQEPTLREFFNRFGALARGTGFLARFLTSCPESTQGFRPFIDAPENWPHLAAFEQRLADILNQHIALDEDGALTPHMLTLSPEAKAAWVEYHDEIEEQLKSGGELYDVRDVASKSADNAARLAALFHIFKNGVGGVVGLESMEAATRIAAWHLNEARRFFGELALPEELVNITRLDTWLINYCRREHTHLVPIAKLQQGGPSRLRRKVDIEAVMRELHELGRARWLPDGKKKMIAVNPILLNEDVD